MHKSNNHFSIKHQFFGSQYGTLSIKPLTYIYICTLLDYQVISESELTLQLLL